MAKGWIVLLGGLLGCAGDKEDSGVPQSHPIENDADTDADADSDADADVDTGDTGGVVPLPIVGRWVDDFDFIHRITEEEWTISSEGLPDTVFHVDHWDATVGYLVAQNDADNVNEPNLWTRIDWTALTGSSFSFCEVITDAPTMAEAEAVAVADRTDPATGGCLGNPWVPLRAN